MRAVYLDLSNGLSFEMLLGSLLSLLDDNEAFVSEFERTGFGYGYGLSLSAVYHCEQKCCRAELVSKHGVIADVSKADAGVIVSLSGVSEKAKVLAQKMLDGIHGVGVSVVRPIVLAVMLDILKVDAVQFSPLNIGKHRVALDAAEGFAGMTVYQDDMTEVPLDIQTAEMLNAIACENRELPAMRLIGVGYGCGEYGKPLKTYLMDSLEYAYRENNAAVQIDMTQIYECKCEAGGENKCRR